MQPTWMMTNSAVCSKRNVRLRFDAFGGQECPHLPRQLDRCRIIRAAGAHNVPDKGPVDLDDVRPERPNLSRPREAGTGTVNYTHP